MDADERQEEIFRKMTPEQRLRVAGEMVAFAKRAVQDESSEKLYERVRRAADEDRRSS